MLVGSEVGNDLLQQKHTEAVHADRLENYKCGQCSYATTWKTALQRHKRVVHNKMSELKNIGKKRKNMSIQEKLVILEKYDKLPRYMSDAKKAENLGLKRGNLVSILSCRDKIFAMRNTAKKRVRYGKEREVGEATLKWVQSARVGNEKLSYSIIQRKASEIAGKMGKKFSPSNAWTRRLCERGNICLGKKKKDALAQSHVAVEKLVTTYAAMDALDVVYNFLMQNDGSQPSLIALEKIMWFVDEKQQNHLRGRQESMKTGQNGFQKNLQNPTEPSTLEDHNSKDKHLISVLERLLFKCGECPYAFSSKEDVELHRESAHNITSREGSILDEVKVDTEVDGAERDKEDTGGTDHEEVPMDKAYKQEKSNKRTHLTIQQKQDVIKQYENIPNTSQVHKAEILGLNVSTLRKILSQREQLFSNHNTAMKRSRRGKEDVEPHRENGYNCTTKEENILDEVDIEIDYAEGEGEESVSEYYASRKLRDLEDGDRDIEGFQSQKMESLSSPEDEAELDLEAEISPITCTKKPRPLKDDVLKSFPCKDCGLVLRSKPELVDHLAYIHKAGVRFFHEKFQKRISLTIQEKQNIIEQFENLPNNMSEALKARTLGLKRTTVRNIIFNREKILAVKNTAMKRASHGKEEEVEKATLKWLQAVNLSPNIKSAMSTVTIKREASYIAEKMGKEFTPSNGWVLRLCKRHNIRLGEPGSAENIDDENTSMATEVGDDDIMLKTETKPMEDGIKKQVSCHECELEFEMEEELHHHMVISHDKVPVNDEVTEEQVPKEKANNQEKVRTRTTQTIQQKQAIIKQYENLPNNMPIRMKAEMLGVKRTTLLKIVSEKENIMSVQNTTRRRLRYGRDEEVEKATLMWLQSAIQSGVSQATIVAKASEIAKEMGQDFKPGPKWAQRICKRHHINIVKDEQEDRATDPLF